MYYLATKQSRMIARQGSRLLFPLRESVTGPPKEIGNHVSGLFGSTKPAATYSWR